MKFDLWHFVRCSSWDSTPYRHIVVFISDSALKLISIKMWVLDKPFFYVGIIDTLLMSMEVLQLLDRKLNMGLVERFYGIFCAKNTHDYVRLDPCKCALWVTCSLWLHINALSFHAYVCVRVQAPASQAQMELKASSMIRVGSNVPWLPTVYQRNNV